ncbi:LysM peptidoglycan-binding domain-containing protein [Microbacterium sp. EYE_5]|uniref:LysM peptidoglycan-binding domain-containing protein n=1 Tax=unclassified Microbacterium TaxID=2609290 RepID=UPI0020045F35|nr:MULTISPECIES: LysM peptidoglycan-binding domain-containing protein [unclassified Microbacterium]MCK6081873.1 LysM peptidoglycan-binding domain-containing protein [Microbacterium sp. EYE_382]MCK6087143.1 LysM peptidoglycan-binding domain-containing protein [Microbacterium sp. EYE_384]MCK6124879.1 LysM peptidoglycan-binding domain-containing protein [Microbacterium sp. EYE_80]MCK6127906.1 LysM peptidoglycan-binding domain-containing protein [Microbacterium sp. EYE_79]MCK6142827.1 LysM peptido
MSTIAITRIDAAPSFVAPRTRLRITTRGRRVLAGLVAVPAVVALGIGILSGGGALASGEPGASAQSFETVTVLPGDSLWTIAQDVAPSYDPRDVVDDIVRLNALSSSVVDAGQSIAIPAEYSAAGE